jgi:hypothetical protein
LENEYDNITVIPAWSNASTYTVMENCDKVISFGSTMGIESSYWGKPSILLGPSSYFYDDVAYIPKTKEEILDLLKMDLRPKFNIEILKFGAYILNKDPLLEEYSTVNYHSSKINLLGLKFSVSPFINFIYNEKLTGFYIAVNRFIRQRCGRLITPIKEE